MSYVIKDTLTINIPQNVTVTPGEKRLRIVLSYDTPTRAVLMLTEKPKITP